MTWTHIPHTDCYRPLFPLFVPHGAIWTCDKCGKRWMLDHRIENDRGERIAGFWVDMSPAAVAARTPVSMEPADVGQRERAKARSWLDRHLDSVYADLGLERGR